VNGNTVSGEIIEEDIIWDFDKGHGKINNLRIIKDQIPLYERNPGSFMQYYPSGKVHFRYDGERVMGYYEDGSEYFVIMKEFSRVVYPSGTTKIEQNGEVYMEYYKNGKPKIMKDAMRLTAYLETGEVEGIVYKDKESW
jgi:hypothetical protein